MANNPYVNKVQYGNTTLIDLTSDTVTADKLMQGYTAHDRTGAVITGTATGGSGSGAVWQDAQGYVHLSDEGDIPLQTKTVTPSETAQTVTADAGYYALDEVNVGAISSTYVGSGITRRSSTDLTASGATVTVPSGYYSVNASKSVANGSVTAPSSISGTSATVSTGTNTLTLTKSVSVTPNVTTAGYISSGTAGNASVSLTASVTTKAAATITPSTSEQSIAAGTYLTGKQTISAMPSGTAGTPTASKGSVSNHAISVTPSVTNTTGYITGGTKTGTAVSVSASELVSGTKSITENGTGIDVTNYASVDVAVPTGGGSSYTPISVGVLEVTANVTSTSVTTITTSLTIDTSSLTNSKMLYVKVRDKAGKRNNYFYGTDIFFPIWDSVGGGTTQSPAKQVYRVGSSGVVSAYTPATTTCYGVYVSGITDLGEVYVMGRYNSSYSLTINGTYSIDVYMLEWPDDVSPMV